MIPKVCKAPKARKPRGQGYERRAEILAAARAMFLAEGYEAVSTRRLAKKAGISQTALYVYFHDKREIYDALCAETFAKLTQQTRKLAHSPASPDRKLSMLLKSYIRFGLDHPDEYQIAFMVTHPDLMKGHKKDFALPREKQGPGMRSFLEFRDRMSELAQAGLFSTEDVTATSQAVLASLHGLVAFLIARPWYPWVKRDRLIARALDLIVSGLRVETFGK